MTQLDKLEMLNSQWKSFANCKNEEAKEYAKTILMYLMSKQKTPIEEIKSDTHHIKIPIRRYGRLVEINIFSVKDCDIIFYEDANASTSTHRLEVVDYFGDTQILFEMFFYEGISKIDY